MRMDPLTQLSYSRNRDTSSHNSSCKYKFAICACIKDEEDYLEEWILYHSSLGFEHFYIYDNNSKNSVSAFCSKKEWADKVTVIDWNVKAYPQKAAYNSFLKTYGGECEWVAFIDIDEYFDLKQHSSMEELMLLYQDFSAVHFSWEIYNASGDVYQKPGTLRERFKTRIANPDWFDGKYICRPSTVKLAHAHKVELLPGYHYVDSHYHIKNYDGFNNQTDICTIAHYFTKSLQEWVRKIQRGSVDKDMCRSYEDFFRFNPEMIGFLEPNKSYLVMKSPEEDL